MKACQYVLSTVFLVAVAAAADTKYASFSQFTKAGCNAADGDGYENILAMGVCSQMQKLSTAADGNITITLYSDSKCSGEGKIVFSAPLQECSTYGGKATMFTASSQAFSQACSGLSAPYAATYNDGNCTGVIVAARAQTTTCLDQTTTSTNAQCNDVNGTTNAVTCTYPQAKCQGTPMCKVQSKANVCNPGAAGTYVQYSCPAKGVSAFCPAKATTKSNKIDAGEIGGIVAAVILIPLVIIGIAVVVYVFLRRGGKDSAADSGLMGDGSTTTYGSA